MCGIVGHIGSTDSVNIVLKGLERLEYRGYDSAGVCFEDSAGELALYKRPGKLTNLKNVLADAEFSSSSCVGHTRWATHGIVNETNSHPHLFDFVALVHNGIIENATELRADLMMKGITLQSQTDSEVFLGLLVYEMRSGRSFHESVADSFRKLKGNSAFVIQRKDSKEIVAIKRGAPLVCGTDSKSGEAMVSSDPYALVGLVDKLYFPEDDVLCRLSADRDELLRFYELDGESSVRFLERDQERTIEISEKGPFEHFMLKEIYEQPGLIRNLGKFYVEGAGSKILDEVRAKQPKRILINACGTAYYAGLVIRDFIESELKVPALVELASEFRYRDPLTMDGDIALFISQSGETADTLAAQQLCKERGIPTYSIVNMEGSSLYRSCNLNLPIKAGIEIGVASTKAFTQQALTGRLLVEALRANGDMAKLTDKFSLLAQRIDTLIADVEKLKEIADKIHRNKGFFFTGRGRYFPVALEGALKLKEIAYVHAEGYAAGELKHGPLALIDEEMVNIAIVGPDLYDKALSNVQEIKARHGVIVVLGPKGDTTLEEISDHFFPLEFDGLEELMPIYVNVANQLLAYHMANFKGTDIDCPRNLAKSVTVE